MEMGSVRTNFNYYKRQPHKMVKHTHTIRRLLPTICLDVFDHFVGLALKGLTDFFLYCNKHFTVQSVIMKPMQIFVKF